VLKHGIGEKMESSHFSEEAEALQQAKERQKRFEAGLKEIKGAGIFGSKFLTSAGSEDTSRQKQFQKELKDFTVHPPHSLPPNHAAAAAPEASRNKRKI